MITLRSLACICAASLAFAGTLMAQASAAPSPAAPDLRESFVRPPVALHSRPLWFWNGPLNADKTRRMLDECQASGYAGVGILPAHGMKPDFMTPEFLNEYQAAVEHAAKLGLKLCLYDEFWFPSGSAGGLLAQRRPDARSKRLDMAAYDLNGPVEFSRELPVGTLMGAVAMEAASK